ncbi:putative efflux pump mfs2 [Exophiala dermatitidis]
MQKKMADNREHECQEKAVKVELGGDPQLSTADISPPATDDDINQYLVRFDEAFHCGNPQDWSLARKWAVTSVLSVTGFNRILVSTIMAPALSSIAVEFHMNQVESVMGLSAYLLATAFGPLVIGPLSELYGRQPVLHTTNVWFLLWNVVCGFAPNKGVLIAARFLSGFGASAVYVLASGVLGDVWRADQRGRSLGLYNLLPLLAASVGPILGGIITQATTWQWIFWSTSMVQGAMIIFSILLFRATYAPLILRKRARQLRTSTGEQRYHSATEKLTEGRTATWILRRSLTRPMRLLASHPIVQIQAVVSGFSYGITYLLISIYSDLWKTRYHESTATSGIHYIAMCLGEICSALIAGTLMDVTYRRLQAKAGGEGRPEGVSPSPNDSGLIAHLGGLSHVRLGCPGLHILAGRRHRERSLVLRLQCLQPGAQLVRSLTAFGFPLFAPSMYEAIGYGWGNTLLALVAVTLCLPTPFVLWRYGCQLRERARDSF